MNTTHEPVMLGEVIESLHIDNQVRPAQGRGKYIDATLGAGGYSKAILEAGGSVLGIDADSSMLRIATENLKGFRNDGRNDMKLVQGNFRDIKKIAIENNFMNVDGIVFDLGVSNVHFMDETRGFSFRNGEADLDMRLDPALNAVRASDLLNALREDQLEEMFGKSLAMKIIEFRKTKRFETVGDFLNLFSAKRFRKIHPATKAFLALRVAVNSELDNLKEGLTGAWEVLSQGGKLVVVSFNSDEDRIVKEFLKSKGGKLEMTRPCLDEVNRNPKARSAILRMKTK